MSYDEVEACLNNLTMVFVIRVPQPRALLRCVIYRYTIDLATTCLVYIRDHHGSTIALCEIRPVQFTV